MMAHLAREQQIGDLTARASKEDTGAGTGTDAHRADVDVIDGGTLRDGNGDSARVSNPRGDMVDEDVEGLRAGKGDETAHSGGFETLGDRWWRGVDCFAGVRELRRVRGESGGLGVGWLGVELRDLFLDGSSWG